MKILLVDDEPDLLQLLRYKLQQAKYEVQIAENGEDALAALPIFKPNLIVLDVMMPKMNGIEVCRRIRADEVFKELPILMLTARTAESDEILGLEVGADDYLPKPVSIHLFLSRVKALIRRSALAHEQPSQVIERHKIKIDRERYAVSRIATDGSEEDIRLPRKEFELLFFLMNHAGKVFSRQDLLNNIWGTDVYVIDRTVDVHIRKIREKLGEDFLETVKGVGYRIKT